MGYGLKADNLKYYPIYPPEVINDPIDMEEQDEVYIYIYIYNYV